MSTTYGGMVVNRDRVCPCCGAFDVDGRYYCHCWRGGPLCPKCQKCSFHAVTQISICYIGDEEGYRQYLPCPDCVFLPPLPTDETFCKIRDRRYHDEEYRRKQDGQLTFAEWAKKTSTATSG